MTYTRIVKIPFFLVIVSPFFAIPYINREIPIKTKVSIIFCEVAFWIAYIFTVVALAAQIVLWKRTFGHKELKSKFLGFPIVHIGIVYLIVQIAVLFVFVFAEKLPAWSALVTCTVIAAMAAIFMIAADVGQTEIEKGEQKVQGKVFYIKNLQVDIEILASAEKDAKTKKALELLAEKIRFSDPMSNEMEYIVRRKLITKDNKTFK